MGQDTEKPSRKPRADGLRNRERLLTVAHTVFAEGGPGASLDAVARQAGVGIGTLYRHFPTREALFEAVYRRDVDQLVRLAEALQAEPDPVTALRLWLKANVGVVATKKGMLAALSLAAEPGAPVYAENVRRIHEAAEALMARGVAAGRLRSDIPAAEVVRAMVGMCHTRSTPDWRETVCRLIDVFVDGLACPRPPPGEPD